MTMLVTILLSSLVLCGCGGNTVSCKDSYAKRCAFNDPFTKCCKDCEISGATSICKYDGPDGIIGEFEYAVDMKECLDACGEFVGKTQTDFCRGGELERILEKNYGTTCPVAGRSLATTQKRFCPGTSVSQNAQFPTISRVESFSVEVSSENECVQAYQSGCADEEPYNQCCNNCPVTDSTATCEFTGPGTSQGQFSFAPGDQVCWSACEAFLDRTVSYFCEGELESPRASLAAVDRGQPCTMPQCSAEQRC